jgi:hypothetical protein
LTGRKRPSKNTEVVAAIDMIENEGARHKTKELSKV